MGDCPAYALSGDVTLSAEDLTIVQPHAPPAGKELQPVPVDHKSSCANDEEHVPHGDPSMSVDWRTTHWLEEDGSWHDT